LSFERDIFCQWNLLFVALRIILQPIVFMYFVRIFLAEAVTKKVYACPARRVKDGNGKIFPDRNRRKCAWQPLAPLPPGRWRSVPQVGNVSGVFFAYISAVYLSSSLPVWSGMGRAGEIFLRIELCCAILVTVSGKSASCPYSVSNVP